MNFGIFEILKFIGALGFFIYGMKVMSDGIQKLAGCTNEKNHQHHNQQQICWCTNWFFHNINNSIFKCYYRDGGEFC